ncbi:MAG TPA: hypothetical protein VG890_07325 [Puia sp.]|nr:hypothetical protein [Puia sp.]
MTHLKLSAATIFSICLLLFYSCNNSSANKTNTSDATASASSANTTAADENLAGHEGSFSYTVNGERVKAINYVQHANLFINEVSNDAASGMLKIEVTTNGSSVFDFEIANNGTTSIGKYHPSLSGFADKKTKEATYMDGKTYNNLYSDSATVTITSISSSRVSGTFSGTFAQDKNEGNQTAKITDGSFNLPFGKK